MPITPLYGDTNPVEGENSTGVPARTTVVLMAGMAAAWIAAGSTGLLAHPLRHALTWVAVAVAIAAAWPRSSPGSPRESSIRWAAVVGGTIAAIVMTASNLPVINLLAVVVVLAALAYVQTGLTRRVLLLVTLSATVLAMFRLACGSIPTLWLAADWIGGAMGTLAGNITGQPLWVGATFAGLDFLVLMAALYAGWLIYTAPPRLARAVYAALAILAGQLAYLIVLSFCPQLVSALPEVVMPPPIEVSHMGVWTWGNAVRSILPWNLPLLAGIVQAIIAAVMFRWATWLPVIEPVKEEKPNNKEDKGRAFSVNDFLWLGPVLLAVVVIPLLTVLGKGQSTLKGKTIVAYDQGFLDWKKPEHGKSDPGTYGALPLFVKSLGGDFVRSSDLSEEDLEEADVLLLIHPNQSWPEDRLRRVWEFVRNGGSLLVAAEPWKHEGKATSSYNEVLEPTGMQVRYDLATPPTQLWEQVSTATAHPATTGMDDCRNQFGLVQAASIDTRFPAQPLLVGRLAFSEPGSDAVESDMRTRGPRTFRPPLPENEWEYDPGIKDYDCGERLGDLVLAAEQRLDRGRIVVLGDSSPLHNFVLPSAYLFTGRLLGYLANKPGNPHALWRQFLGVLAMAGFVGLLAWRAAPERIAVAAVVLAVSLALCLSSVRRSMVVLPGGERAQPYGKLAYIDASHLEAYRSNTWDTLGVGGLMQTLMRNGYLPLYLPEVTSERLSRADLLISIGPSKQFSRTQRRVIAEFVRAGGTFVLMVGSEASRPSADLLEDFNFEVPPSPVPPREVCQEPEPLTHSMVPSNGVTTYLDLGDYTAEMHTDAAWRIRCTAEIECTPKEWGRVVERSWRPGKEGVVDMEALREAELDSDAGDMIDDAYEKGYKVVDYTINDKHTVIRLYEVLKYSDDRDHTIIRLPVGKGEVVVIGDTLFATNRNLESEHCWFPHNIPYWRWFLPRVTGGKPWIPPKPEPPRDSPAKPEPRDVPLKPEPPSDRLMKPKPPSKRFMKRALPGDIPLELEPPSDTLMKPEPPSDGPAESEVLQ